MKTEQDLKNIVKEKYGSIARSKGDVGCCGDDNCIDYSFIGDHYEGKGGYDAEADLGLGCGIPTEFARIKPGSTVVDLGSGAGNDAFVARSETGEHGRVIGIDFTEEMIQRAKDNASRLALANVEFRQGDIEDIPLADQTADIVISNCVFNLVPDKESAFNETFRILKAGGHFSISDVVVEGAIPLELQEQAELYAGCVSGAINLDAYLEIIRKAGFEEVIIEKKRKIALPEELIGKLLSDDQKEVYDSADFGIYSVTVFGRRPADDLYCGDSCC
ncbi:MAG: arsenite methyltransferase [Saprospiraceae bacterium]|nr:arsenite methyltransferase [Saprospiraceae bacterium]